MQKIFVCISSFFAFKAKLQVLEVLSD